MFNPGRNLPVLWALLHQGLSRIAARTILHPSAVLSDIATGQRIDQRDSLILRTSVARCASQPSPTTISDERRDYGAAIRVFDPERKMLLER
jgi:hypothetical protein